MALDGFKEFVLSGNIMDLVLLIVFFEAAGLIVYHRVTHQGPSALDTLANLASGFFLMLGLRLALTHASWMMIVATLGAAFVAHLYDLRRRWPKVDEA
jgi:Ni,Fe-hydrogenase I cytochrome b subunit